jgi:hypothetical protein
MKKMVRLCEELERVAEASVAAELPRFLARADALPANQRHGELSRFTWSTRDEQVAEKGPAAGWLWDLFDGRFTPRLFMLTSAWLTWEQEFVGNPWSGRWGSVTAESLLVAMGRVLDPEFDGRGFTNREYELEHAGDYSYGNEYELRDLKDSLVSLDIALRSNYTFRLYLKGPSPAVFGVSVGSAA